MLDQIAHEHIADLRRDAAAHPRVVSRADRAVPRRRAKSGFRLSLRSNGTAAAGCEA